jgi:CheY-like chemotaxis protein
MAASQGSAMERPRPRVDPDPSVERDTIHADNGTFTVRIGLVVIQDSLDGGSCLSAVVNIRIHANAAPSFTYLLEKRSREEFRSHTSTPQNIADADMSREQSVSGTWQSVVWEQDSMRSRESFRELAPTTISYRELLHCPTELGGEPSVETSEKGPSRILVVDDSIDTVRGMEILLKHFGYEVETASDGLSAIEIARRQRPHFVLLDIGLPGIDGYEIASRLRREDWCESSILMAISGYGREEDRRRSREAGFDHHLIKPVDHRALFSLLAAPTN